ncbi:MAG: ABC transporter ATP-binding protein [Candidatus Omnitrophica bacterium]|nr:ABC transporter ATP-binding protein [Candidatus Omnitrophota bacterium]
MTFKRPLLDPAGVLAFCWRTVIRPYPGQTMLIVFLMLASSGMDMAVVGLSVPLMDALTVPEHAVSNPLLSFLGRFLNSMGVPAEPRLIIFTLLILACGLFVLRAAFSFLYLLATSKIGWHLRRQTKAQLFERFLTAPFEEVAQRARGVVVHHINNPAQMVHVVIGNVALLFTGVFDCLVMLGLILYLSWWATLLVGVLAVAAIQGWRRFTDHRVVAYGRTLYDLRAAQSKLEVDAIDGFKVVKAHNLPSKILEQQRKLLDAEVQPTLRADAYRIAPNLINEVVAALIVISLGAGAFLVPNSPLRFSMLVAFLLAIRRIAPAMARINSASSEISKNQKNFEILDEILVRLPRESSGAKIPSRIERIELREVTFAYPSRPEHLVLKEVGLTMRRGTVTALVGPTGSGKSTLAHLLMGLYAPLSGGIWINGEPMPELDLISWRRRIGYVSQDIFVFNATVRENIALWEEVSDSQIQWATGVAELHEFISTLPHGYDSLVGDRGLRLSGGQCQRLAIARAILRRPDVLIFDEATSALDNLTERAVYDAISAVHKEAIVILVAHRLSTVREADQIVVLQGGGIVESGVHGTLIHSNGLYARLYEEDSRSQGRAGVPSEVLSHGT